jgi:hypothetical protein
MARQEQHNVRTGGKRRASGQDLVDQLPIIRPDHISANAAALQHEAKHLTQIIGEEGGYYRNFYGLALGEQIALSDVGDSGPL